MARTFLALAIAATLVVIGGVIARIYISGPDAAGPRASEPSRAIGLTDPEPSASLPLPEEVEAPEPPPQEADASREDEEVTEERDDLANDPASQLSRDAERYLALHAEVSKAIAEYRASRPIFEELAHFVSDSFIPLLIESERARGFLAAMKSDEGSAPGYDAKSSEVIFQALLAIELESLAEGAALLRETEGIVLSEREAANFDEVVARIRASLEANAGAEVGIPYAAGSVEHARFLEAYALSAVNYVASIASVMRRLPPELERARKDVEDLYQELGQGDPSASQSLPRPQVDPFPAFLESTLAKARQIGELERDLEQRRSEAFEMLGGQKR